MHVAVACSLHRRIVITCRDHALLFQSDGPIEVCYAWFHPFDTRKAHHDEGDGLLILPALINLTRFYTVFSKWPITHVGPHSIGRNCLGYILFNRPPRISSACISTPAKANRPDKARQKYLWWLRSARMCLMSVSAHFQHHTPSIRIQSIHFLRVPLWST